MLMLMLTLCVNGPLSRLIHVSTKEVNASLDEEAIVMYFGFLIHEK